MAEVNIDEEALLRMVKKTPAFTALEARVNDRANAIITEVNQIFSGRSPADVDNALREKFREAGISPVFPEFANAVKAIAAGTMPI